MQNFTSAMEDKHFLSNSTQQTIRQRIHACMQKELSDPLYIQRRFFYMKQWDTEDNNRYLTERHKNLHILHVECQVPQLVYDLRIYTVKMNCLIKKSLMCKIFQKKTFQLYIFKTDLITDKQICMYDKRCMVITNFMKTTKMQIT